MFLSPTDVKAIADRLFARSRADSLTVAIEGGETHSLRFAHGGGTTNVSSSDVGVRVSAHVGGRTGSVATNSLEQGDLERALSRAEELARVLPPDPEFMEPLGPQDYPPSARYAAADGADLAALAGAAKAAIREGLARKVNMFGCASTGWRFEAFATSNGLFAYDRLSEADFSTTARNLADSWSGWAGATELSTAKLDAAGVGRRAAEKAAHDASPLDLEPGRYTVVLEPAATAELMRWVMSLMNARAAEEGRSFFSRKGGGARLGEALFSSKLTVRSDPRDPRAPEKSFGSEGLPQRARYWIENGVVTQLFRSRYWAQKTSEAPVPAARSFTVAGGEASLEELIGATERGVLVTRFWYTNLLEPRAMLLTGLTRDGNFLIENGKLRAPLRNMRFNESLATALSSIEAIGRSERTWMDMNRGGVVSAPPMRIASFNFSSRSSGI